MSQKIRIKLKSYDHNLVDKSAEKIVKTVKSTGAVVSGPNSASYPQKDLYSSSFTLCKQESQGTVPALFLQKIARHLQLYAENYRRADET